jgi:MIP family channel proteins
MNDRETLRQALCEFLGPFTLVFAGVGAIIATQGGNLVAIAFAHGLAIGLMVCAVGHISGGHFNPAVTLGFLAARRITIPKAIIYIIAQLLGAIAGAAVLTLIFPALGDFGRNNPGVNNGVPAMAKGVGVWSGVLLEVVLTFFLMWVIFGVAVDGRTGKAVAGLAIGLTITMGVFAGGVVSGAMMNPSRAFGPAVIQQDFTNQWIWWVGPIIGAVLAALVYNDVLLDRGAIPVDTPTARPETVSQPPVSGQPATPRSARSESRRRR